MGLYPLDAPVEVSIAAWPWGAYLGEEGKQPGIRAKVSSWRRISADSLIPHAKAAGQYLNSVLAKIEASKAGYQEAILLDTHGFVCEGSGENIFVVRDGQILTPPQTAGILDGISRKSIIQIARDLGFEVVERDIARAELYLADEVFMSGTAAELVPVREIDDHADRRRRARADHARAPARVRRRAARPRPALRASGSTWSTVPSRAVVDGRGPGRHDPDRALRHHPARRDAGRGDVALGRGEAARRPPPRRARDRPDRGRVPRARTPRSSSCSSCSPARRFEHAEIAAFGMTPPARPRRPRTTPPCGCSPSASRPVCTLVGKTWALHLEKVVKVDREENLRMIAESVAFLVGAGQARRLRRRALLRRLRRRPRLRAALPAGAAEAGAETVVCCDTNGGTLPDQVAAAMADVASWRRLGVASGSTATTTPAAGSPTRWPRCSRARPTCRGR